MEIDTTAIFDVMSSHRYCRECNALLKDYGGKKSQMHQFGPLVSDVWVDIHRIRHKKRRDEHPCQLPVHLVERLLLMSSDVDDVVLDPFIGTGTTAIAAKKLGRRFIGIDIEPKYVEITNRKLEQVEPTVINGCYVSIFLDDVVTVSNKDWEKIKGAFVIPQDPLELEKGEIYLLHKKSKIIKRKVATGIQSNLFPLYEAKE